MISSLAECVPTAHQVQSAHQSKGLAVCGFHSCSSYQAKLNFKRSLAFGQWPIYCDTFESVSIAFLSRTTTAWDRAWIPAPALKRNARFDPTCFHILFKTVCASSTDQESEGLRITPRCNTSFLNSQRQSLGTQFSERLNTHQQAWTSAETRERSEHLKKRIKAL